MTFKIDSDRNQVGQRLKSVMADYDFEQSGTTFKLTDWKRFETFMESLQEYHSKDNHFASYNLLFRGHGSADWKLATTLERVSPFNQNDDAEKVKTFNEYYRQMLTCKAAISSYTGQNWNLPTAEDFDQKINELLNGTWLMGKGYDKVKEEISFMAHLRHHGYPSPLLDWTASPYVALLFAYHDYPFKKGDFIKSTSGHLYLQRTCRHKR